MINDYVTVPKNWPKELSGDCKKGNTPSDVFF